MSCCAIINLCACKGETFQHVLRWGTAPYISKAITAISRAVPAAITAVGHGVPDGWPVAIASPGGMTQIGAEHFPPQGRDWKQGTKVDVDTVTVPVDSINFTAFTTGGALVYPTPISLSGITMSMSIYDNAAMTGTPLLTLTSTPAAGITLDNTAKTIALAFATAALTWSLGYYKLLATITVSDIREVCMGTITIDP